MNPARAGTPSLYTQASKRKYVTPEERRRFIAAAKAHPRQQVGALCLTLAYTGCRISEALALTASAVDPASGTVAIFSLKKRGLTVVREIPVPLDLIATLRGEIELSRLNPDQRLWPFCRNRAWQLVKTVMSAARVPEGIHATPKGLRHGFGVHAIRSGVPLTMVQRWLGHASVETTAIYLQAVGPEERELAGRMW